MDTTNKTSLPFIILLGRPGCGKSLIYKTLSKKFQAEKIAEKFIRIDDFPILQNLLDKDVDCKRHEKKDGGFAVTDWTIIDEVLQIINKTTFSKIENKKIIFIEFSRANYQDALKNFDEHFLTNSIILYIKTSLNVCLQRNEERFKNSMDKNIDDHIVPPDLMKTYYSDDDFENIIDTDRKNEFSKIISSPVFVLDNNIQNLDLLNDNLDQFVEFYKGDIEKK